MWHNMQLTEQLTSHLTAVACVLLLNVKLISFTAATGQNTENLSQETCVKYSFMAIKSAFSVSFMLSKHPLAQIWRSSYDHDPCMKDSLFSDLIIEITD